MGTDQPASSRNPNCYAQGLGGCSDDMSREHMVSEGALNYVRATTTGNPSVYARNYGAGSVASRL
jgi:hypothetical protein